MAGWMAAAVVASGMVLGQAPAKVKVIPAQATASGQGFKQVGMDPTAGTFESGTGRASLEVHDKVRDPNAANGDSARLDARLRVGSTEYSITFDKAGWSPMAAPLPPKPPYPVAGGVMLDRDVFGGTGLGSNFYPLSHAAIVVWGIGSVAVDGKTVAEHVPVQAFALSAGFHADDETFSPLRAARDGDTELFVLASNLPPSAGMPYLELGFDNVRIEVAGVTVKEDDAIASSDNSTSLPEGSATGGSGPGFASVLPLSETSVPGGSISSPTSEPGSVGNGLVPTPVPANGNQANTESPSTPAVANASAAPPESPGTPTPANATSPSAQTSFVTTPTPANASSTSFTTPASPAVSNANATPAALPSTPAPANSASAPGLISTPMPMNAAPAAAHR